jgi:Ni,Fe-hydrogenase I large subunit
VVVETGALARTQTHPIVAAFLAEHGNAVPTRMMARLVELAQLLARVGAPATMNPDVRARVRTGETVSDAPCRHWVDAIELAPGEGLAAVQTARGLLLHRARIADGRVAAYQIVAPTEWNFHPRGALVRGLEGAPAEDEAALVRDARLVVQALDPCVACRVEVAGA